MLYPTSNCKTHVKFELQCSKCIFECKKKDILLQYCILCLFVWLYSVNLGAALLNILYNYKDMI